MSAELLSSAAGHYTFISSLSAYADESQPDQDENSRLATMPDETAEEITGETYGPLKVLSEQAAEQAMPGRVLIIRPGLIVGPHDPSDRFTYWPHRVAQGGEVLAPGRPERPIQYIDVRDLAEWNIRLIENGVTGAFNAITPSSLVNMGELLEACRQESSSGVRFTWVDEAFLAENNVEGWMDMPLWLPESDPQYAGFFYHSAAKATAAGLTYRPVNDTVRDTLEWDATRSPDHEWRAGISREREAELLAAWHSQVTSSTGR
jgi:2'-hydroxyisoflavone reductase